MEPTSNRGNFSVADGIARILLIASVAIMPFLVLPLPYVAISQSKVIILAAFFVLAVFVWAFARLSEGSVHAPRVPLLYVSMLLPIAYLVSAAVSGWNNASLVGVGVEQDTLAMVGFMTALFLLVGFLFYNNSASVRMALKAGVLGFCALFALQALYIFLPTWFSLGVFSAATDNAFGSWHDLGIIAGLGFFVAATLVSSSLYAGWRRIIPILLGVLSLFILVVVHFADIFFGSAILFALAGLFAVRTAFVVDGLSLPKIFQRAVLWFVIALALGAAGMWGVLVWDKLPEPIRIVQTEVRPSWQGTFEIARQSLVTPSDIIFGTGPNSFIREWGLHKPAGVNATPFWNSDFNYGVGIIPTSIFASGVVGLIAWAALIFALLGLGYRMLREGGHAYSPAGELRDPASLAYARSGLATGPHPRLTLTPQSALFGATLIGVAYLVVYHMIYTPGIALSAATFIGLGLLAALAAGDAPARVVHIGVSSITNFVRMLVFVVCVLAAIAAAGFVGREVLSNILVNKAAYAYQTNADVAAASRSLAYAFMVSPNNDRAHRAAAELGVIELAERTRETDPTNQESITALQETLQRTIQHGLAAVSIDDSNYQNWLLLAQVYSNLAGANIDGAYEQAQEAYERALATNPTNPLPKYRLAQLAVAKQDIAAARAALLEATAMKPDFAAAYFLLSQVEAADGKGDAAVAAATEAVRLVPDDPLGWFNLGYILYAGAVYQDAAAALNEAVVRAPDYSNALFYLGLALHKLGDNENAARALDRVVALNPSETWVAQAAANVRAGKEPTEGIQLPAAQN